MPPSRATHSRPTTLDGLRQYIQADVSLPAADKAALLDVVTEVFERQRLLWQESKHEAIRALSAGFAEKVARLHSELVAKEATVSNIARYFEDVVTDLTEKAHRDPKTQLMNFAWFMERLEAFLAVEQRVRWCAIGIVDLRSFKWYNDNLGHALGDRIIERVAHLLAEQVRSQDLVAKDRGGTAHDLQARFGGDEFSFLIIDVPGPDDASNIAARFKTRVESFDWSEEHPRLAERPVTVDVGVVCLRLGPIHERRGYARALAEALVHRADQLMYGAKGQGSTSVFRVAMEVSQGALVERPWPGAARR